MGAKFFRHELVARLERSAFQLPPQLDDPYSNLAKELNADALVPRVLADEYFKSAAGDVKDLSDSKKEYLVRRMAQLLPDRSAIAIPYTFKTIKSYWTGTITNSSSAQITAAQLYLNGARFSLLTRDDNSQLADAAENVINVGDLRPKEKVQLSVWSVYDSDFYEYAPDVRLTYPLGVGKVTIPRLVTGFPAFLGKYQFPIYFALFWIFVVVLLLAIAAASQSPERETSSGESAPSAGPPGR